MKLAALLLLTLTACSSSGTPSTMPIADAGTACEPRVRYTCDCGGGRTGNATCSDVGARGGCECGRVAVDDAGGDEDAAMTCAAPTAWYRDADGDGFGSGVAQVACTQPAGWAAVSGDCNDEDARAHPGQVGYFSTEATGGGFDFDCNHATTKQYDVGGGACQAVSSGTCNAQGTSSYWEQPGTPACGATSAWVLACPFGCAAVTEQRVQGCR